MARWEPNAQERIGKAAMELYVERGFDATTVADIAARAGLTERTFFRHFADKREVLFAGSSELRDLLASRIAALPASMGPMETVAAALDATSAVFEERRAFAKVRMAVIHATPALMERELIKMASLAAACAEALRKRGVAEPAASLASEAGLAVFRLAFDQWVNDPKQKELAHHLRESLKALKAIAVGRPVKARTPVARVKRRKSERRSG